MKILFTRLVKLDDGEASDSSDLQRRVSDPSGFLPDPTFEKILDPDPIFEKILDPDPIFEESGSRPT
mgnify:CR=1 FL=1